jgi:hypothetical protein
LYSILEKQENRLFEKDEQSDVQTKWLTLTAYSNLSYGTMFIEACKWSRRGHMNVSSMRSIHQRNRQTSKDQHQLSQQHSFNTCTLSLWSRTNIKRSTPTVPTAQLQHMYPFTVVSLVRNDNTSLRRIVRTSATDKHQKTGTNSPSSTATTHLPFHCGRRESLPRRNQHRTPSHPSHW